MTLDLAVVPGLLVMALEFLVLAVTGFVVARVALRQRDDLMALAQGLVIGPALWGLTVNFVMRVLPGMPGALVGWLGIAARGRLACLARPVLGARIASTGRWLRCLGARVVLDRTGQPPNAVDCGRLSPPGPGFVNSGGRVSPGLSVAPGSADLLPLRG